jgi:hypothetical protein
MKKKLSEQERIKRRKINKYIISGFVIFVIIVVAASSGNKQSSTSSTNKAAGTSVSSKKAAYQAALYNIADDNNISMTYPAGGWDNNDGWDTAAQASVDDANASAVTPAVVELNSHQLQLNINVKNTGNAAGTPNCKVEATSATASDESNGKVGLYYGVNYVTVKALDGGPIKPGDYGNATDTLTITGQGALYVRQIKINC